MTYREKILAEKNVIKRARRVSSRSGIEFYSGLVAAINVISISMSGIEFYN